ncbi:hypothetical protein PR202_ga14402 [Eleusine coracana subsp. coracana]|uniref:Uncharacterized protein n=1 Tax=Eleusine coracana subsp. coracana TaxID=191504 RepID=A0AAV5CHH4_ELECO|nr:hypothetical protein PR202_ga14402 [Eleusine coracana subsp. coracana]
MAYSGIGGGGKMSAVDAILAEAADLVALEQIAKLNTAHLTDDSALPSSLESRFRKLKSLPAAPAAAPPVKTLGRSVTAPLQLDPPQPNPTPQHPAAPTAAVPEQQHPGPGEDDPAGKKENSLPPPQQLPSPPVGAIPPAVRDDDDDDDLERLFGGGRGRPMLRERNRGTRNLDDDDSSTSSPPPRQACCFGFSPKKPSLQRTTPTKSSKKKVHGSAGIGGTDRGDVLGVDADEWGDENRRMVTELKEQQRKLKKALEEQVKVSRETAKMARWVKQASARMTHTDAIDDLLSDCEDDDEFR